MAISSDQFNGIDLSRLPPPQVVQQLDFVTVRDAMLADIIQYMPQFNALTPADPAVKLVEYCAFRELLLRQQINEDSKSNMLAFATGGDLDHIAATRYELERFIIVAGDPQRGIAPILESDEEFRDRIVRSPETWSVAGPVGAYVNMPRNASDQVRFASAIMPTKGRVLVTVQARLSLDGGADGGSLDGSASAELLQTVAEYLSDETRRPMTDHVIVQSAIIKPFTVTADMRLFAGAAPQLVLQTAQTRLREWLADNARLARDITEDAIHAQLRVEGVSKVTLQGWEDIICNETETGHCTAITLRHIGIGE